MINKRENFITISDIGLASLLQTLNFQIVELKQASESKRINFVFRNQAGLENAIKDFWANKTFSVPAHSLFNNHKVLKNRIWARQ